MKHRYTAKELESDIAEINRRLERLGHAMRLGVGYAYNRTELDLCTPEQLQRHCRQRLLDCGTPRECLAAAKAYLADYVLA